MQNAARKLSLHSTSGIPPYLVFFSCLVILLLVTATVYGPVVGHQFIAWDDQAEIYFNPDFNPVTWQHLCSNLTQTHNGLTVWMPLTYFIWGGIAATSHQPPDKNGIALNPILFHAANYVFHLFAVGFCFLVLRRLLKRDIPAVFGAALFALHPLQVEPVAWASGMYTVLSGAFSLAAIYGYLRSLDASKTSRRWIWFAVSTLLFIAAMLTKPSAIVLPVIVGVIQLLGRRLSPSPLAGEGWGEAEEPRFSKSHTTGNKLTSRVSPDRIRLEKSAFTPQPNPLPQGQRGQKRRLLIALLLIWLPLALADFLIAKHFQPATNVPEFSIPQRCLVAGDAISFYLAKLFAPFHLAPDYSRWPARILSLPTTPWMLIPPILLIIIALASLRRAPRITTAIALFLLGLSPFLGFVRFDYQFYSTVADRYAYLAMFGPALLLGAILARWPRWPIHAAAGLCLFALMILTLLQIPRWQDTQTLFTYTAATHPDSFLAHRILAGEEFTSDPADAEKHFQTALAIRSDDPTAHYNYAVLLERRHDLPDAIVQLNATVAINPQHFKAWDDLGVALMQQRKYADAQTYFDRSIQAAAQSHADYPQAQQHLALAQKFLNLQ